MFGTATRERRGRRGRDTRWWPLLVLLLTVVLLPTACLVWMTTKAIDNERLAVRQVLAEVCRGQLGRLQDHWNERWQARSKQLEEKATGKSPQAAFAAIVHAGLADSAIVCNDRRGPDYPELSSSPVKPQVTRDAAWTRAEDLEYVAQKPLEAAKTYAALAKDAADADVAARAILAEARCLAHAGRRDAAIDLLADTLASQRFARVTDADGRLIAADAELRALELIGNPLPKGEGTGQVIALFRTKTIDRELQNLATEENLPTGVGVELLPPKTAADPASFFYAMPAGNRLPDWQLAIKWNDDNLAGATAHGKIVAYVLVGSIAVSAASVLAFWIAMSFRRQMRLARLKNDLVAAVSHELKTPLASIRLLVDTLLADDEPDRRRLREYLELIAKENARLGRVIDNFLAFSRMERNKHTFTPSEIAPADVVAAAADAAGERFSQNGCHLEVHAESDLPPIMADADAMTTALVNLLDNAYKYTDSDKQISLRAHTDESWVYFDVTDNGIGLSRAACRRVFERFYQVDRELSRSRGGCGLGLSIVEFISREHGGRVSVRSQPGKGSTFTIAIPCCRN